MQGYMLAAIGVSHGGKTTKIHAVVDALFFLAFTVHPLFLIQF